MPQGNSAHGTQLLRLCSKARERQLLSAPEPVLLTREARTPQLESSSNSLQLEKACTRQQGPSVANKYINKKFFKCYLSKNQQLQQLQLYSLSFLCAQFQRISLTKSAEVTQSRTVTQWEPQWRKRRIWRISGLKVTIRRLLQGWGSRKCKE